MTGDTKDVAPDRQRSSDQSWSDAAQQFTLERFVQRILEHRRVLSSVSFAVGCLVVVVSLLSHRIYKARVSFLPADQNGGSSALVGLASQVGLNVGGSSGEDSPDFYADFLLSEQLLRELVTTRYPVVRETSQSSDTLLVDYLAPAHDDSLVRVAKAIRALRGHLVASTSATTGVVTLDASFTDPVLAYGVTVRALDLVNAFNVQSRQSQAGAQRRFLETQVTSAAADLRASEDSLLQFLQRNRDYRNSPTLSFQFDRQQRAVAMRQSAYTQVFQSYLQAQAAEVQNTPVITVVGPPTIPALGNARNTVIKAVLFAVIAFILTLVWILGKELARSRLAANPRLAEAVGAAAADASDLIRPLRFWDRSRRPGSTG